MFKAIVMMSVVLVSEGHHSVGKSSVFRGSATLKCRSMALAMGAKRTAKLVLHLQSH